MNNKYVLFGSLMVSWLGTAANWATEAKSIVGALSAMASLVASCYAIAIARQKLKQTKRTRRGRRRWFRTIVRGFSK